MKEKIKVIVPCVTTKEALFGCLKHKMSGFCIETCLYRDYNIKIRLDLRFICYRKRIDRELQIIILEKRIGKNKFDKTMYELVYPVFL